MTDITVRGSFSAFRSPERATVHATISYEGPAMEPVYERVARDLEAVKATAQWHALAHNMFRTWRLVTA